MKITRLLRQETFGGQTVKMEEMGNGNFTVTSFGLLSGKKRSFRKIEEAGYEYGAIKMNITKHYMGGTHYE